LVGSWFFISAMRSLRKVLESTVLLDEVEVDEVELLELVLVVSVALVTFMCLSAVRQP
jgi:hypothetical protein